MLRRWIFARRFATKTRLPQGRTLEAPPMNDSELLEAIEKDPEIVNDRKWRSSYYHQLSQLSGVLDTRFQEKLQKNLRKIESYNVRINTPIEERIRVDLTKENLTFRDFYSNLLVAKAIENSTGITTPTEFQKRIFALASGYVSTVAVGEPGTGKSTALFTHGLFLRRAPARGEGINSLVLVNSGLQAVQMRKYAEKVYQSIRRVKPKSLPNIQTMAQFLYRADQQTEEQQIKDLMDTPCPHILVSTPQRLLDLLATRGMDFMKVNSLAYIGVDDIDHMMDTDAPVDAQRKTAIVKLLDYVLKLQDYRRFHNEPHPQLLFTTTAPTPRSFLDELQDHSQWFDWSKFHEMGSFTRGNMADTCVVPKNVGVGCVLVRPSMTKSNKVRTNLVSMKAPNYGERHDWEQQADGEAAYVEYWKRKRSLMDKPVREGELAVLVSGLVKLLKKQKQNFQKTVLVIVSDETSVFQVQGLLAKLGKNVEVFNGQENATAAKKGKLLIANVKTVEGMTFKSLDTMVVLGLDALRDTKTFVSLCGRFRNESGLIAQDQFGLVDDEKEVKNKMIILSPVLDVGEEERNHLHRLCLRGGLVKWIDVVGVSE
ncbi:hypothetical protein KL933_005087 [Ogataea haglerorum]|uniref:ATP-dependent RNA helicase n=1 Tax=Ogataea haglerorum TaxID=1937702 RepID=A0AAN6HYZ8_9ASCO|nr:hypothetical protein KL915_005076 [Ogataea haglerorum]KAG7713290.1 hypothetical protein KL913_005090 [Ogataea haglerorum]KAG7713661.1 hypothetical protein KL949_005128 [Ogataea haglerorum]KAG7724125.1 hypothetical protein KL933_005087 [Ogataea haglerorum]KAG7725160.1 hypothetical protein KL948_005073 [Ogataea haglerorum]